MENDIDEIDTGPIDDSDEPSTAPETGDELRGDIEEAIAKQKVANGDPEPYRGLKGRTDNQPGGHYEGCDEFAKEAARNGTTLKAALADYHGIEKAWRGDPVKGLKYICQKTGVNPVALAQRVLQSQQQQPQSQFAQQYQVQQNYQAQAAHQQEYQRHVADIEASRRSMPFFESLRPVMAKIAQSDPRVHTVKQAYDLALKLNPTFGMSAEIARRDAVRDRQMGRGKRR